MLTEKKRQALELLVGKKAADNFLSKLSQTESEAQAMGVGFKSLGGVSDVEMNGIIESLFGGLNKEKAKEEKMDPPSPDAAPDSADAEAKAADGEMDPEDSTGETEIELEQTISAADLSKIADMLAERVVGAFDMITGKLNAIDEELKTRGYSRMKSGDAELTTSLKEFTNKQTDFASEMVKALEEINTRLKSLEANGTGFTPSSATRNVIGSKERGLNQHSDPAMAGAYDMWFRENGN